MNPPEQGEIVIYELGVVEVAIIEDKREELTEILRRTQIESDLDEFLEEAAQRAEIVTLNPV